MIKDQLLSKNGTATMILSRELLKYAIGDRIPTITEFSKKMSLARGTVQNALKNLIGAKAIVVKP
ncbi:MAG: GntR family transcriptional regulator, partial [Erysipelotrichaceae bacterium]|nr:GntR family transcriptional regulator [Erysipelotrichaceae bacterium]